MVTWNSVQAGLQADPAIKLDNLVGQEVGNTGYRARRKGMGNLQRERNGIWTIRVTIDGRRICKSTGTCDRGRAEKILQKFLAPYGLGENKITLMQAWRKYELSPKRRDLSPTTLISKKRVWHFFANWVEEHHPQCTALHHVTTEVITEFLAEYRIGHTGSTYNNNICVIREIFHTLSKEAGIYDDPWEGIKLKNDDSHVRRELSVLELKRLMTCACELGDIWRKLFTIGIYTGLRLGDCCKLDWSCVLLDRGIIQVIPQKTRVHRKGKPVTIPIHPTLLATLMETPPDKQYGFVVPELGQWYSSGKTHPVQHALKQIFHAAGIRTGVMLEGRTRATPDASFHSLRHTFVSLAVNAGVPIAVVQSIVGHESNTMTRHYYHEDLKGLISAVSAIPTLDTGKRPVIDVKSNDPEVVGAAVAIAALPAIEAKDAKTVSPLAEEQK